MQINLLDKIGAFVTMALIAIVAINITQKLILIGYIMVWGYFSVGIYWAIERRAPKMSFAWLPASFSKWIARWALK